MGCFDTILPPVDTILPPFKCAENEIALYLEIIDTSVSEKVSTFAPEIRQAMCMARHSGVSPCKPWLMIIRLYAVTA